jgi:predicted dienelactone hydrolase
MKRVNKSAMAIGLLTLASCAVILPVSDASQNQSGGFKRELPAPTGKFAVGRAGFHWVDESRPEAMTADPNDRRELMVTLWYPAESATGEPAPYIDNLDKLADAPNQPLFNLARFVRSYAIAGARISSAELRYPALIFSPGNQTNVASYAAQIEDLASHGYVVLGIDHPYESQGVIYPDGRIVRYSEDKRPKQGSPNFQEEFERYYRQRVDWRAADATFVLNQLEKLGAGKTPGQFSVRLDLARVGAFGHSMGGVAAAQTCQSDRRFKACLNLDGKAKSLSFFPDANGKGPEQPFMTFEKTLPAPTEKQLAEWKTTREQVERAREQMRNREADLLKTVKSGAYRVTLRGATHQSFSDEPLILPFGDADAKAANRRRTQIIREYTLAFLDQVLRKARSNLLKSASSDYPKVTVERFGASQE